MKEYLLWLAKVLTIVVLFLFAPVLLLALLVAAGGGRSGDEAAVGDKLVAVVELKGVIMNSKDVVAELYRQARNDKVKGIVLRIDSPGGSVGPAQDINSAVKKLREQKPIVVSMGGVAASGGLYAALNASKIFCQPGTLTGSIGVIMQIPNVTELSQKIGVDLVTIKSGRLKDAGNMFRPMTEEERRYLEDTVAEVRSEFVNAVVEGRGLERAKVEALADGRVLTGAKAVEAGLVDQLGDVYDAAREVFVILKEPLAEKELPRLFYPEDKFAKFRRFFDGLTDLSMLLGQGAPRELRLMYLM